MLRTQWVKLGRMGRISSIDASFGALAKMHVVLTLNIWCCKHEFFLGFFERFALVERLNLFLQAT